MNLKDELSKFFPIVLTNVKPPSMTEYYRVVSKEK